MKHFILILALGFSSFATAETAGEGRLAMDYVKETIKNTDPAEAQNLQRILQEKLSEPAFVKMSGQQSSKTYLSCATVKSGAVFVAGRVGVCVDSRGRSYSVLGVNIGPVLGTQATMFLGYVESKDGNIEGIYDVGQFGLANGAGFDVVSGDTAEGQKVFLVGGSLGVIVEMGIGKIQIKALR